MIMKNLTIVEKSKMKKKKTKCKRCKKKFLRDGGGITHVFLNEKIFFCWDCHNIILEERRK